VGGAAASTRLQAAAAAAPSERGRQLPVILKIVLKAGYECTVHWKKFTNESKGKPKQKFYGAFFGTIIRISECFQRSKKKLHRYYYFFLEPGRLKI
jgi:hypothetical protein